eukprot:SAG25_NODE_2480_length_1578_cov_1.149899_1_plen_26_part_10
METPGSPRPRRAATRAALAATLRGVV